MLLRIKLFGVKRALVIPTLILFSCLQRHNMRSWGAGGERDDRGWDGWMASLTRWTWVWVNSRSWWWTGRPGGLQFMGSQRVGHYWATELNWNLVDQTPVTVPLYFEVIDPLMALFHFRKTVLCCTVSSPRLGERGGRRVALSIDWSEGQHHLEF